MSIVKEEVTSLLERLPEDASIEGVQYHCMLPKKSEMVSMPLGPRERLLNSKPKKNLANGSYSSLGLRVVIQGFLKTKWLPWIGVKHVALDGFRMNADDRLSPLRDEEFYEFD